MIDLVVFVCLSIIVLGMAFLSCDFASKYDKKDNPYDLFD